MRYELYKQLKDNEHSIIFYIVECNHYEIISTYIENFSLSDNSKYIVIDNEPQIPVNYLQLGFTTPPTMDEYYEIIYECKLAREYYRQIREDDYNDCYLNQGITELLLDSILSVTKFQTEVYFKKYNARTQEQLR